MAKENKDKKKPHWEPTLKIKPPDGIKSSDYTNAKPFVPSYEKEPRPKMAYLMSNEYSRIWQKEHEELEKKMEEEAKSRPPKKFSKGLNSKKLKFESNKEYANLKKGKPKIKQS